MKMLIAFVAGLIAGPLLLIIAGMLGLLGSTATASPPGWENELGEKLLDTALEHRASGLKNPIRTDDAAALAEGQELYGDNCAGCHGDRTGPSKWGANGFYPRVPQFWQATAEEHEHLTPEEAYVTVRDGIRYTGMGAWAGMMKEDEMWKVANFVASIHHHDPANTKKSSEK